MRSFKKPIRTFAEGNGASLDFNPMMAH